MNVAAVLQIYERLWYLGDSTEADGERLDLRLLVAEAISRLPPDVQGWLLNESMPLFIGGHGQLGEHVPFSLHQDDPRVQRHGGYWFIPVVFLSEQLREVSKPEALWVVAREIAHMRLCQESGGLKDDWKAERLATAWGFRKPAKRPSKAGKKPHRRPAGERE